MGLDAIAQQAEVAAAAETMPALGLAELALDLVALGAAGLLRWRVLDFLPVIPVGVARRRALGVEAHGGMLAPLPEPVVAVAVVVGLVAGLGLGRHADLLIVLQELGELLVVGRTAAGRLFGRNQTSLRIQADMALVAQILGFLRADLTVRTGLAAFAFPDQLRLSIRAGALALPLVPGN